LNRDEHDDQDAENHEERDDASIGPWVLRASPLEGKKETHDGRDKNHGAEGVELPRARPESNRVLIRASGRPEEKADDDKGHRSDG